MTGPQITLVEYDPSWPDRFEAERNRLENRIGDRIERIEQIGSTAVEGLAAKPIIDMTASIPNWNEVDSYIDTIETLGYDFIHESAAVETPWRYFEKRPDDGQAFNLHLRPRGSPEVENNLLLRESLSENPEIATKYEELKRQAASEHPDDLRAYSEAKTEFIDSVLETAREPPE